VLDNVSDPGAMIGDAQLGWLKNDLTKLDKDARIVVFTHRPLFDLYPQWDWATRDGAKAVELLMPFQNVTVLDLSESALGAAKARLGDQADNVQWVVADVTTWEPPQTYDLWHDRAAFHFLTDDAARSAYVDRLRSALKPTGHVIIGAFALNGPERCSGLPVTRHDAASLAATLGPEFELIDTRPHQHVTPWGATQQFQFSTFRRA